MSASGAEPHRPAFWHQPVFRRLFWQIVFLVVTALVAGWLIGNTRHNLEERGISTGFAFLQERAGFDIIMSFIPYDEDASYGRAFLVALCNTLFVSGVGIMLATVLGFAVGLARLSTNWLLSRLALVWVEGFRNIPLLLQLFFWYFAVLRYLPAPRQSLEPLPGVFLNIRGLYMPWPVTDAGGLTWDVPQLSGFNFSGGLVVIPELIALVLALALYTSSYIAEIVRAGITAVGRGQHEGALALGLRTSQVTRFVVLPQALRVIIPPLTSQYLNLTKNSSLAAAIAFPDLVLVFAGTILNQTGQAIEVILLTMLVYLVLSLMISVGMNLFNRRVMRTGGQP